MLDMGSDPDSNFFTTFFNTLSSSSRKNNKIQRRFTNQQIKSLETIFQSESKLESHKKLELAKDLGLEPRQVAIWFQNKRARWKSKKLEKDYNILRASYDSLLSRFDLLNRENQLLTLELKKLHEVIEKKSKSGSTVGNSSNSMEEKKSMKELGIVSDTDSGIKPDFIEQDNDTDMLVVDMVGKDNWYDLESEELLNSDTCYNQWWDG